MKKLILIFALLGAVINVQAITKYPSQKEIDHIRWWKINRGMAMGTGIAGLGLLTYNVVNSTIRNAQWDDQSNYWNMNHKNGFVSDEEFQQKMQIIERDRDKLAEQTRRNYWISGGLFVASAAFVLNAHRHSVKANNQRTTVMIGPGNVYFAYRF